MRELDWEGTVERGRAGPGVRRAQEWLTLQGYALVIDGDFGPATELAVREFQEANGLAPTGEVDAATFAVLSQPLRRAAEDASPTGALGRRVAYYAERHLKERAREVGGANRGPWVRTYMNGNEGPEWAWCAGFACFILGQAARSLGIPQPIATTFSCDTLAARAKAKDLFLPESRASSTALRPGDLFLHRRGPGDWSHVGVVLRVFEDAFLSIEGNTNDGGEREGHEVSRRIRAFDGKDFVRMPD
jgi:hypothetical protein